jgi:HEAT repeat protein
MVRVRARRSLVAIREPAVRPLVEALASRKQWVRWEVAKALGQIGSPSSAEALVPLLHALVERSDSVWVLEGAHHVFHDLARGRPDLKDVLQPVLAALEDIEPSLEVPVAAEAVLNKLIRAEG